MANEEHLEIFRQGVEIWNQWRKENPKVRPKLDGANLAGLSGSAPGANLKRADLRGAKLYSASLHHANLKLADLRGADLYCAQLESADLRRARLVGSNLDKANLRNANLERAWFDNLSKKLSHTRVVGAFLVHADLRGAIVSGARLRCADLRCAILVGARFDRADLRGVLLNQANLEHASLERANLGCLRRHEIMRHASLHGANLTGANLTGAYLDEADLSGVNLTDAQLEHAHLEDALLHRANLKGANLTGAHLQRAGLVGVHLAGTNLERVIVGSTVFASVDLRGAKHLESVRHWRPSSLSISTLERSRGLIPGIFLRGCGLSDWEIESTKLYNPELDEEQITTISYEVIRLRGQGHAFFSAFISYAHEDQTFARALHDELQGRGVRCWFDERQLVPGDDIHDSVDRGIRLWDKILLVCSEASLTSWWVEDEITKALEKERRIYDERGEKVQAIIPLDLDGYLFGGWKGGRASKIRERLAANFRGWRAPVEGEAPEFDGEALERVMLALRSDPWARELPPEPKI